MKKIVRINHRDYGDFYAFQSDRSDKPFLNNMRECRSIEIYPEDIIADIGAYIGEYANLCISRGATNVRCYEPTFDTFQVLAKNQKEGIHIFNAAVVPDGHKEDTVTLNISKGIGVTNSIAKEGKAEKHTVSAIRYSEAVRDATVVKIDVEGAEYMYENIIQPSLRAIILEFHPIVGLDWKANARKIMKDIQDAGFKPVILPTFNSGWELTSSFIRNF